MRPKQILPFHVKVDLGVMALKGYSTLTRSLEFELYHWMQFSVILRIPFLGGSCLSAEGTLSIF